MAKQVECSYEVVVVGGGLSGVAAAIACARHGARTALIQDRAMLGGNASSEIRMHVCGAGCGGVKENLRETGILEELLLENRRRNPAKSFPVFDTILWEKARFQENLALYLNTRMTGCQCEEREGRRLIRTVSAIQLTTEKEYLFSADIFVDATGDGLLCALSGAEVTIGRESRAQYGEPDAPEEADAVTLGSSLMFRARDMGRPTPFIRPDWAYTFTEEDLKNRPHDRYETDMESYSPDAGFWWVELGGTPGKRVIEDGEEIRDELMRIVFGVWDHIKNGGDHGAENFALDWVQLLPGKRESRRIVGQYVLTENDILGKTPFPDAVAYGGWPMDIHAEGGFWNKEAYPTNFLRFEGCYAIPYRCYLPRGVDNLMAAGRIISATHMAFGSARVMGTCAVGGQAVGTAAAMAIGQGCLPIDILGQVEKLQQLLLRDDCYIPGICNRDEVDLARRAQVAASHDAAPFFARNVINGIARSEGDAVNLWQAPVAEKPWLELRLPEPHALREIQLRLDSDLSNERQLQVSLDKSIREIPFDKPIPVLLREYELLLYVGERLKKRIAVRENAYRFVRHLLTEPVRADRVRLCPLATGGAAQARVFEIRLYE